MSEPPERIVVGRLLLAAACASAVALVLPMLWAGPLALDEHNSYWVIDSGLPSSSLQRALDYTAIPPLSAWMQQVSLALLGKSEFAFRLPMALSAIAAVIVVYFAGKQLRGPVCGGIAALLLAWYPETLDEVRIGRCYGLVLLLAALVLLATVCWLESPRSYWRAGMWGLASAGLLWTHYTSALLVAVSAAAVGLSVLRSEGFRPGALAAWLSGVAIAVGLSLPLVPAVIRITEWGPYLNYMASRQPFWHVIGPIWWLGLPIGWTLARTPGRRPAGDSAEPFTRGALLLAACSLLPLIALAVLASSESTSSLANPRYRIAYAPPAACLMALLLTSRTNWGPAALGAAAALTVAWICSPLPPWQLGRLGHPADETWHELNRHLDQHAREGEPILVQSGLVESYLVPAFAEDRLFMEYTASRVSRFYVESTHPRYALPFLWAPETGIVDFFRQLIHSWEEPGATFWVACATDTDLNRNSLEGIRRIAGESGFTIAEEKTWPHAVLLQYAHPSRPARNRGSTR